jgi:hypothetical protein
LPREIAAGNMKMLAKMIAVRAPRPVIAIHAP